MTRREALALAALSLAASPSQAEPFHGYVYEAGLGRKVPLFKLRRTETREPDGTMVLEGYYTPLDPSVGAADKDAIHETARVKNGKLLKYIQEQNQLQAWGTLELRGQKLHFAWAASGQPRPVATEDVPPNLIVSATSIDYLREHWDQILAGTSVNVRLAVLDRQETVGFQFSLSRHESRAGRELVHVRMKPTSFFVQLAVSPIEMVFDRKSVRLLELKGYVGLKKRVGNRWKDLDTEMVYEYDR